MVFPRVERAEITLHGHRFSYRRAGSGPLLVLLHGIAGSSATWEAVMPWLSERHTVIAPDLLGHGESSKPVSKETRAVVDRLTRYVPLRTEIESCWLRPEHRRADTWLAHENINEVMLATSLEPEGFVKLGSGA
jgi:pimeloyl-ACP methyl ester carboxylesterase